MPGTHSSCTTRESHSQINVLQPDTIPQIAFSLLTKGAYPRDFFAEGHSKEVTEEAVGVNETRDSGGI